MHFFIGKTSQKNVNEIYNTGPRFADSNYSQLERQIHEDEEFARTLALLDEEPRAKKVIRNNPRNTTVVRQWGFNPVPSLLLLLQARKGSEEQAAAAPKPSCSDSAAGKRSSPSPKKSPAPVRTSSKLAMMKKRDEEKEEPPRNKMTISPAKVKISPKKEPVASSNPDKRVRSKTEATPTSVKISPKKPEVTMFPDQGKRTTIAI